MNMGALSQYINLYKANKMAINAHSTMALNEQRENAFAALMGKELPGKGVERYEKTSIDEMFAPDYGININRVNIPFDMSVSFHCDIPNLSTLMAIVVNDTFIPPSSLTSNLPQGVIVDSIAHTATTYPEIIKKYYGKVAPLDNVGVALNTMLVQDGFIFYVPRGIKIKTPVQLVNIFNSKTATMGIRRLLIIVEDEAEAKLLICDHSQNSEYKYLSSQVVEIYVGASAWLDICDIEESSLLTSRYSQMFACQQEKSNLLINGMTLINGTTRNNFDIDIVGESCETIIAGMAIGSGNQHIDNCSNVRHKASHCHSMQLFKYVLDDESKGAFEGSILVTPQAPFTEAYQSNRNMLASTQARMHTKPQLEIYNDDVKCSHGATTGQLDAEALFYMRSRGIPEKIARTMLMQAFMTDVIDTIRMTGMRERLRHLVEKRFYGQPIFCADCRPKYHK